MPSRRPPAYGDSTPSRAGEPTWRGHRAADSARYHGDVEFSYDEIDGEVLIIRADGGLNADTADGFLHDIESLLSAGLRKIIVDCERLEIISSAGIGALIRLHQIARAHEGEVKIAGARGVIDGQNLPLNYDPHFRCITRTSSSTRRPAS